MSVLKYKDPVTGEVKTVGSPSMEGVAKESTSQEILTGLNDVAKEATAQQILTAVNNPKTLFNSIKSITNYTVKSNNDVKVNGTGIAYLALSSTGNSQTITVRVDGVEVYSGANSDICSYQYPLPIPFNSSFELTGTGSTAYTEATVFLY